jgi:hypothetical protein
MKKLIFSMILIILSEIGYSQYFLGETKVQVLQDAEKSDGMKIREQNDSDGKLEILWEDYATKSSMDAIFCGDHVCVFYIMPHNHKSADAWATNINKSYALYKKGVWKGYSQGSPFYIKVGAFNDGKYYFRFTYTE